MKENLVCIDSDGCAIDSMECKHRLCFGPYIIDVWHLEQWKDAVLNRWNEINLYSMTRGINRFLGLEMMLSEVDTACCKIDGLAAYSQTRHQGRHHQTDASGPADLRIGQNQCRDGSRRTAGDNAADIAYYIITDGTDTLRIAKQTDGLMGTGHLSGCHRMKRLLIRGGHCHTDNIKNNT